MPGSQDKTGFKKTVLTPFGMVQALLFRRCGHFLTVSEIRTGILNEHNERIDGRTIRKALTELHSISGLVAKEVRRIGPFKIPVTHYSINKI